MRDTCNLTDSGEAARVVDRRATGDEQGAAGLSHKTSREMNAGLRTSSRTPLLCTPPSKSRSAELAVLSTAGSMTAPVSRMATRGWVAIRCSTPTYACASGKVARIGSAAVTIAEAALGIFRPPRRDSLASCRCPKQATIRSRRSATTY